MWIASRSATYWDRGKAVRDGFGAQQRVTDLARRADGRSPLVVLV